MSKPIANPSAYDARLARHAEGKWHHHWDRFLEVPEGSIIVHCDRDDVFAAKKIKIPATR